MLEELVSLLVQTLNESGDFSLSEEGLSVKGSKKDNVYSVSIEYNDPQKDVFEDYLNSIDDDLFIEVCESMGEEKIKEIQNLTDSEVALRMFKEEFHKLINSKINKLKRYLD